MQATAFVVGEEAAAAVLKDLARQVGFRGVHGFRGVEALEAASRATPLVFVLFSATASPGALADIVRQIRASADRNIRYAPLIYFADSPSLETIHACIGMGFDDIVALPLSLRRIAERLNRQVERDIVYYETETYFGPDRRGRLPDEAGHVRRGTGGAHRRLDVVRHLATGIRVAGEEQQVMI